MPETELMVPASWPVLGQLYTYGSRTRTIKHIHFSIFLLSIEVKLGNELGREYVECIGIVVTYTCPIQMAADILTFDCSYLYCNG